MMDYWNCYCLCFWILSILNAVAPIIHSPPLFVKQPPPGESLFQVATNPDENEKPFYIECEAVGEPAPRYRWIKNGKPFNYETYDDRIVQQPGRGTLVIKSPRDEDFGQYQCFAENEFGVATSNSVFLRKAELNSFKDELPITKEAKEGDPFKLGCQPPDGWPKPIVYWLLQGQDGTIKMINNSRMTVDPEGNLWFSNITRQDASDDSVYACVATSIFRNEYKLGNKVILKVLTSGSFPGKNKHAPVLQYVTRRQEVAERDKTKALYCIFGGTPLPETVWFKNGKVLQTSDRVSQGNYGKSLTIKHVTQEDEGDYTCKVSNGVGDAKSHSIKLTVKAAPYFTEEPKIVISVENETAEIRCRASGIPEPQILWIYNGKPISEAPPNPRRTVKPNSITIEWLQKSDTGNYGCKATSSIGYVYKDVYINVLALAPDIIEPPHDEETVNGKTVIMTCRASGFPKPQIKWVRNGLELTGGRYSTLPNGDLQITNTGFGDMGDYTCFAENKIAKINATASLSVKQRTAIKERPSPSDHEVKVGTPATFRCTAQKDESLELTIDWLRNGQPINFDLEPRFVKTNDNSLTITKTTELDSGEYTCLASTRLDNATAKATLIVEDIPNPPELRSVECHSRDAVLEWTPMGDNRAPILSYIIEYNTSFAPDSWNVANGNVPASAVKTAVEMTPWANYTFRVIAKNKIGSSIPSKHSGICKTDEDLPYKNPANVQAQGREPTNLVISWSPMPQIEHHAPHFYYEVAWRRNIPGAGWETQKINRWETSECVVYNVSTFVEYEVKVTAFNEKGQAKEPVQSVIGYSGEDSPMESPRNVKLIEVLSATTANISWIGVPPESVRGHFKGYKIQIWPEYDSQKNRMKEVIVNENITQTVIHKLTPNTRNFIRVLAFNGKYSSPPSEELSIITPEGVPDVVQSLDAYPLGCSAFLLVWKSPLEINGQLTGYKIYYQTVKRTVFGLLQERGKQINDPNQTQAKLAGLEADTKYRIYIRATTKAGQGKPYFIEQRTRSDPGSPPFKPDFDYYIVETNLYVTVRIQWLPYGRQGNCTDKTSGSHFYVKYRVLGHPIFERKTEYDEDFILIHGLQPNEQYEFVVASVDEELVTESDSRIFDTRVIPEKTETFV